MSCALGVFDRRSVPLRARRPLGGWCTGARRLRSRAAVMPARMAARFSLASRLSSRALTRFSARANTCFLAATPRSLGWLGRGIARVGLAAAHAAAMLDLAAELAAPLAQPAHQLDQLLTRRDRPAPDSDCGQQVRILRRPEAGVRRRSRCSCPSSRSASLVSFRRQRRRSIVVRSVLNSNVSSRMIGAHLAVEAVMLDCQMRRNALILCAALSPLRVTRLLLSVYRRA